MGEMNYIKGDLFQLVGKVQGGGLRNPILAHSCNCYGVWGGGVAYQFKLKYPNAYQKYHEFCLSQTPSDIIGNSFIIKEPDVDIVCLFTSLDSSDSPKQIVNYTKLAIQDMMEQYKDSDITLNIPQINSGIFGVPWEMTETVLKDTPLSYNVYVL